MITSTPAAVSRNNINGLTLNRQYMSLFVWAVSLQLQRHSVGRRNHVKLSMCCGIAQIKGNILQPIVCKLIEVQLVSVGADYAGLDCR